MLKKTISASTLVVFLQSSAFAIPIPNGSNMGDVFNGNSNSQTSARFGSSPSVCNDPQISQIERSSGTTARVFEPAASGSKQGQFGRWLETNGYVYHTGVCAGTGSLVMFIYNNKIPNANRVANDFFASNSSSQNGSPDSRSRDEDSIQYAYELDKKKLLEVCGIVFQQQGNFNGYPSCASCRIQDRYPDCLAQAPRQAYKPYLRGSTDTTETYDGGGGYNPPYNPSGRRYPSAYDSQPGNRTPGVNRNPRINNRKPIASTMKISAAAKRSGANGYFLIGTASERGECIYSGTRVFATGDGRTETIFVCIGNHRSGAIIKGKIYPISGNKRPYYTHIEGFFEPGQFYVTKLNNQKLNNKNIPVH